MLKQLVTDKYIYCSQYGQEKQQNSKHKIIHNANIYRGNRDVTVNGKTLLKNTYT